MATSKKWSEFSRRQQTAISVGGVVQVTLLIAALLDIRRRPADQIRGPKALWALVSLVNFVGPITYFVVGRKSD